MKKMLRKSALVGLFLAMAIAPATPSLLAPTLASFSAPIWLSSSASAQTTSGGAIFRRVNNAWQSMPGQAFDVAIGGNNSTWVIGTNAVPGGYGIYRWTGSTWQSVDGGAVGVAVDQNGNPWVVNDQGHIFRRVNNAWQVMPGRARDIEIGKDGSVWVIGSNTVNGGYGIYRWNGSDWQVVDGGAVRIAVDSSGNPWVVNSNGDIFRRTQGRWQLMPGRAKDIAIGYDNSVWVIGFNAVNGGYGIYRWNGSGWQIVDGGAVRIAVNNSGNPWVVNNISNIGNTIRLPWPNNITGRVNQTLHVDGYGRPSLDIVALPAGTPVLAPADVRVISECDAGDNHRAIHLEDNQGRRYSLIHVTTSNIAVGKTYRQGEQVGVVASNFGSALTDPSCARSSGVHLHFGLPSNPTTVGEYSLGSQTSFGTLLTAR